MSWLYRTLFGPPKCRHPELKEQAHKAGQDLRLSAEGVKQASKAVSGQVVTDILQSIKVVEAAQTASHIVAGLRGKREHENRSS